MAPILTNHNVRWSSCEHGLRRGAGQWVSFCVTGHYIEAVYLNLELRPRFETMLASWDWRGDLAPWMETSRKARMYVDIPPLVTAEGLERLWFTMKMPDSPENPTPWTRMVEAMELLELLTYVDPPSGWRLLLEIVVQPQVADRYCGLIFDAKRAAMVVVLPPFRIVVAAHHLHRDLDTFSDLKALAFKQSLHTEGYDRLKQSLQQNLSEQDTPRETQGRVQLSISFNLHSYFEDDPDLEEAIDAITDIALDYTDRQTIAILSTGGSEDASATMERKQDTVVTKMIRRRLEALTKMAWLNKMVCQWLLDAVCSRCTLWKSNLTEKPYSQTDRFSNWLK